MVREVDGIYVDEFHCPQNLQSFWWNRLRKLDGVPVPTTYGVELDDNDEPSYEYILKVMNHEGWDRAFIRGDSFSDKVNPRTGSVIREADPSEIRRTVETLTNHLINHMDTPMGEAVFVREWLDLDYCSRPRECTNWHPTELRFIVEGGEIQSVNPSLETLEELNRAHECTYDYLRDRLTESDLSEPWEHARTVAEEFDEWAWHVDFCLTTSLEWYCIDMGLNGVYWDEESSEWTVMTGQPESLEEQMLAKADQVLEPRDQ